MTHRTSFALDDETIRKMRALARRWRVSQAEVVRRAISEAADRAEEDPIRRLREFHSRGGLAADVADGYMAEVRGGRAGWRRGE
jgi:hypothetical protein